MPVHLYGVLEAAGDTPVSAPTKGIEGRPVRALTIGARTAWVSDLEGTVSTVTPQRLLVHDWVLRAALSAGASVVPARVGRVYPDDDAVLARIASDEPALEQAMELVRGRVEMSILIHRSNTEADVESPVQRPKLEQRGHEHLYRLRSRLHGERNLLAAASDLADRISRALGTLLVAERTIEDPMPPVLASRAHLIARDEAARYIVVAQSVAIGESFPLQLAIRGSGAAYSFCESTSG